MYYLIICAITLVSIVMLLISTILMIKEIIGKGSDKNIGRIMKLALYAMFTGALSSYLVNSPPLSMETVFLLLKLIFIVFLIITLHEMGHFLAAKAFKVPVSVFSVGVGPKLFLFNWKNTTFIYKMIPLMGYVKPNIAVEEKLPLLFQCIFYLAGIFVNIVCFFIGLTIYFVQQGQSIIGSFEIVYYKFIEVIPKFFSIIANLKFSDVVTPEHDIENSIGVYISMADLAQEFWIGFAVINIMLALFNMLPIPVLDGGRVVLVVLTSILGIIGIPKKYIKGTFYSLLLFGAILFYGPMIINNIWSNSRQIGMALPEYLLWTGIIVTGLINIQIFLENRRNKAKPV
ncbi:site-2 protease family protein [Peribacillus frigoritolerans]|uniref:site-2 protease family protein n=1 Tax=Peribacillus frigoritolerans TaxID=450367 RepID=UPI0038175F45